MICHLNGIDVTTQDDFIHALPSTAFLRLLLTRIYLSSIFHSNKTDFQESHTFSITIMTRDQI